MVIADNLYDTAALSCPCRPLCRNHFPRREGVAARAAHGLVWVWGCSFVWGGGLCNLETLIKGTETENPWEGFAEAFLSGCVRCCRNVGNYVSLIVVKIFKAEESPQVENQGPFQEGRS